MDEFKKGRDLGTFLRQRVALAFREGENTQVDPSQTRPRPDPDQTPGLSSDPGMSPAVSAWGVEGCVVMMWL